MALMGLGVATPAYAGTRASETSGRTQYTATQTAKAGSYVAAGGRIDQASPKPTPDTYTWQCYGWYLLQDNCITAGV
jgi:hypothetical protein